MRRAGTSMTTCFSSPSVSALARLMHGPAVGLAERSPALRQPPRGTRRSALPKPERSSRTNSSAAAGTISVSPDTAIVSCTGSSSVAAARSRSTRGPCTSNPTTRAPSSPTWTITSSTVPRLVPPSVMTVAPMTSRSPDAAAASSMASSAGPSSARLSIITASRPRAATRDQGRRSFSGEPRKPRRFRVKPTTARRGVGEEHVLHLGDGLGGVERHDRAAADLAGPHQDAHGRRFRRPRVTTTPPARRRRWTSTASTARTTRITMTAIRISTAAVCPLGSGLTRRGRPPRRAAPPRAPAGRACARGRRRSRPARRPRR